ncbi:MAG TPA: hypothetical protein PKC30_04635 [Saprospiraceae bacterium]|nr:hypothetical protein [Saprospiraceae bacterium]
MKKHYLLFYTALLFFSSCMHRKENKLVNIYNDPVFIQYPETMLESSFLISQGKIDINEFSHFTEIQNLDGNDMCAYLRLDLSQLKGGEEYFRVHC